MSLPPIGGFPHSTMLPVAQLNAARRRAQQGALAELESLLWFRQNIDDFRAEKKLMQAYSEYAEAMMCAADTLRRKMAIIRNYTPEDLTRLIMAGVGFEHMETANALAETANKKPLQLLNEAVELGGENGRPMTVEQLISFALGEKPRSPILQRVTFWMERLGKFPTLLKWDDDKSHRYQIWLDAGMEFFK